MRNFLAETGRDMELERRILDETEEALGLLPSGKLKQSGQGKGIYIEKDGIYKSSGKEQHLIEQIRNRKFLEQRQRILETNLHWQTKLLKHYNSYNDAETIITEKQIENKKQNKKALKFFIPVIIIAAADNC